MFGSNKIDPLIQAQHFLICGLRNAKSDLEKLGTLLFFKSCYELSWKTMKRILSYRGIEANSPREVFRLAAREKLIDDLDKWFDFIEKRNLTTHVYNLKIAEEIFSFLPLIATELDIFVKKIRTM